MQTVVETPPFLADSDGCGLAEKEREALVDYLSKYPDAGDLIQGTGGCRKLRFALRGRGKRGGIRVISYYWAANCPVFLLAVFAKGERSDLSQAERNSLMKIGKHLQESYSRKVVKLRK